MELKYKAQKSHNNETVYFDLKYFLENDNDKMPAGMQYVLKNIRQFTGFLIEEKEIYVGYILQDEYRNYLVDFRNGSFVVVHEPSCGTEREGDCKTDYLFDFLKLKKDNIEIIGNIDDNPNLLQ